MSFILHIVKVIALHALILILQNVYNAWVGIIYKMEDVLGVKEIAILATLLISQNVSHAILTIG